VDQHVGGKITPEHDARRETAKGVQTQADRLRAAFGRRVDKNGASIRMSISEC
jgi:hypothetical protein